MDVAVDQARHDRGAWIAGPRQRRELVGQHVNLADPAKGGVTDHDRAVGHEPVAGDDTRRGKYLSQAITPPEPESVGDAHHARDRQKHGQGRRIDGQPRGVTARSAG